MQKKFLTNLALLLVVNLLVKPFWIFGIDRTVQNTVGADDYGFYATLFNFSFLFNILLDLGINNFNNRNIAQHQHLVSKHFSRLIVTRLGLGLLYGGVTLLAGWALGYGANYLQLLLWLAFNQFLAYTILYLRSNLSGLHLFRTDSLLSVLDRSLMILICGALLWGDFTGQRFQIEWFVYAQSGSYLLTLCIAFVALYPRLEGFRPRFDWRFSLTVLRQSIPYALLILLMTFYYKVDAVMIERLLPDGARQVGIYYQGFRLLDAAHMIAVLFAGLLLPILSRMLKQGEAVEEMLGLSVRLLAVPAFVLAVACWLFQEEIMALLYQEQTAASAPILGMLMAAFVPIAFTYVFGTLLTANGSLRQLNWMGVGGVVLNIGLNWVMIPSLEAYGAAVASCITQLLTALAQMWIARQLFGFTIPVKFVLHLLGFALSVLLLAWGIDQWASAWSLRFWTFIGGAILLAIFTRTVDPKSLFRILRRQ